MIVMSALGGGRPADAEEVRAVKAAGCGRFVVCTSKCDMLGGDTEGPDLAGASIRDILDSAGLFGEKVEVVRGSKGISSKKGRQKRGVYARKSMFSI